MRTILWFVVALLIASSARGQAPDFSKGTATVLVFITTDCPISNRYAPEITRISQKFSAGGVRFSLVYPVPTDTAAMIEKHLAEFAYGMPAIRDSKQALVKFAGASVTPEVAVVDRHGKVVYRGRIDNRFIDFGKERAAPTTHDLEDALEAVVAGKTAARKHTPAIGCYLPDLIK